MSAFRPECGFPATKLAAKPVMFATTPHRLNLSIGRRYQGPRRIVRESRYMGENSGPARDLFGAQSAARRSGEPGWALLLLVSFAGNVVVATLAWFLVSLFLK